MDRKVFFDSIRSKVNLTTQNVSGMDKVLDYMVLHDIPVNEAAYHIATAWWETAQTMWPVKEAYWLSEAWRKKNLRYYPYYGRGHVQLTWKDNYKKMGNKLGVDLVNNPNLMLDWKYSIPALFIGMQEGMYTGKKVRDYIDTVDESDAEDLREYKLARKVVNGTDRATEIGRLALTFEKALRKSGYKPTKGKRNELDPDHGYSA